jgi:hypothetical protein
MTRKRAQDGPQMTSRVGHRANVRAEQMAHQVKHFLPGLARTSMGLPKGTPIPRRRPPPPDDFADTCLPDEGYHGSLCDGRDR